jgi:hypothetical protein
MEENKTPEQIVNKFANEFEFTGNPAIDMVASCYSHYKRSTKKLKEIILRRDYYQVFVEYIKKTQDLELGTQLVFGDVEINCGEEVSEEEYFSLDPMKTIFY